MTAKIDLSQIETGFKEPGHPAGRVPSGETAQIVTATVELAVVRIGKKQMTKAVYNQLPVQHVVDPATLTLRGEVWGWVNMIPDRCSLNASYLRHSVHVDPRTHLHVLWSSVGVLYRCCFPRYVFDDHLTMDSGHVPYDDDPRQEQWLDEWKTLHQSCLDAGQLYIAV